MNENKMGWENFSVEKFYAALFSILEKRDNVKIEYTITKRSDLKENLKEEE